MSKANQDSEREINLMDWIAWKLTGPVFENSDKAFPEFHLVRYDEQTWKSQIAINNIPNVTIVRKAGRCRILDLTGKERTFVDYIIERDKVDLFTAVKSLAGIVELKLPKDAERYRIGYREPTKFQMKDFSLETFFRVALGSAAILLGLFSFVTKLYFAGIIFCALGVGILYGIKKS